MKKELTLKELLTIEEIIREFVKEDQENKIYFDILTKLNRQIMDWIPF